MATDLSIYEGMDKTWTFTIVDSNGDAIDITGYSFLFVVKQNITDEDSAAIIKKIITTHSDPINGVTEVTIDASDTEEKTGKYIYDFQYLDAASKKKMVLPKAKFEVLQRVGDAFV